MAAQTVRRASRRYQRFHGRESDKTGSIELEDMSVLTYLGDAVAIEYETKKHRDRVSHVYRHEFENGARVYTNGRELIVHGAFIKITEKGIEG